MLSVILVQEAIVKLVDAKCKVCGKDFIDVFVANDKCTPGTVVEDPTCDETAECGQLEVVLSVGAHGRHTSWEVR